MLKNLKFLKNTTWDEVFATWKSQEGSDPVWRDFAVREKGWESWEDWRMQGAERATLPERTWSIYEIKDVSEVVPQFLMGPFYAWQHHFEERNVHTFETLIQTNRTWVENIPRVQNIIKDFPVDTQLIGVYIEEDDQVVLFEGHHRCAAMTLTASDQKEVAHTPTIALTTMTRAEKEALLDPLVDISSEHPNKSSQ